MGATLRLMLRLLPAVAIFCTCFIASCGGQQQSFASFAAWLDGCVSPRTSCAAQTASTLEFMASQMSGRPTRTATAAACAGSCPVSAALDAALSSPAAQSGSCLMFGNSSRFTGFVAAAASFSCQGPGDSYTHCATSVPSSLQRAGISTSLRSLLAPGLSLTGSTLSTMCTALVPSVGCCMRSWALLMSALAQQLCLPALALQYFNLPGRCEVLGNASIVTSCDPSFQSSLAALLPTPTAPTTCSAAEQQQAQDWLSGRSCTKQDQAQACFTTACDLWCTFMDTYSNYLTTDPNPSPSLSPPAADGSLPPDADSPDFNKHVKAFIIAFSVIVLCCVLAFLVWYYLEFVRYRSRRSKSAAKYEAPPAFTIVEEGAATPRYTAGPATAGVVVEPAGAAAARGMPATSPSLRVARAPPDAAALPDDESASFASAHESAYGTANGTSVTPSFTTARDPERMSQTSGSGQRHSYAARIWSLWGGGGRK